jgi:hypothetical protein
MSIDEIYTSEFLDKIQTLKHSESEPVLFCKLLVAFFAVSNYRNMIDHTVYNYNTGLVNELINKSEPKTATEGAVLLQLFFKVMFKIVDKDKPDSTVTMTDAIVDTFTKMMNLSAAQSSLKKTGELREYTKKEELQLINMDEAMHKVIGTRNHIVTELVNLTRNADPVYKKAEQDDLDLHFIKSSMDFLILLLQFNESN